MVKGLRARAAPMIAVRRKAREAMRRNREKILAVLKEDRAGRRYSKVFVRLAWRVR